MNYLPGASPLALKVLWDMLIFTCICGVSNIYTWMDPPPKEKRKVQFLWHNLGEEKYWLKSFKAKILQLV